VKSKLNTVRYAVVFSVGLIPFYAPVHAGPVDEYQAAWMISTADINNNTVLVNKGKSVLTTKLLPEKLFVADEDVYSLDKKLLLAKNMQLILMDYKKTMVCSMDVGVVTSLSNVNRVCMIDNDNNGSLDVYFSRSFGRSSAETDGLWFAMNRKIPKKQMKLASAHYSEIDVNAFLAPPKVSVNYIEINDKSQVTRLSVAIDNVGIFYGYCSAYFPDDKTKSNAIKSTCGNPIADINVVGREGESLMFEYRGRKKKTKLRFDARYGVIGHEITRVRFL
jgi:hypothetical protein